MARVRVEDGDVAHLFRPGGDVERLRSEYSQGQQGGQQGGHQGLRGLARLGEGLDFATKVGQNPLIGNILKGVVSGVHRLSAKEDAEYVPESVDPNSALYREAAARLAQGGTPQDPQPQAAPEPAPMSMGKPQGWNVSAEIGTRMPAYQAGDPEHHDHPDYLTKRLIALTDTLPHAKAADRLKIQTEMAIMSDRIKRAKAQPGLDQDEHTAALARLNEANVDRRAQMVAPDYLRPAQAAPQPIQGQQGALGAQGAQPSVTTLQPEQSKQIESHLANKGMTIPWNGKDVRAAPLGSGRFAVQDPDSSNIGIFERHPDGSIRLVQTLAKPSEHPAMVQREGPLTSEAAIYSAAAQADTPEKRARVLGSLHNLPVYADTLEGLIGGSTKERAAMRSHVESLMPKLRPIPTAEETELAQERTNLVRAQGRNEAERHTWEQKERDRVHTERQAEAERKSEADYAAGVHKYQEAKRKESEDAQRAEAKAAELKSEEKRAADKLKLEQDKFMESQSQFKKKVSQGYFRHPSRGGASKKDQVNTLRNAIKDVDAEIKSLEGEGKEAGERKQKAEEDLGVKPTVTTKPYLAPSANKLNQMTAKDKEAEAKRGVAQNKQHREEQDKLDKYNDRAAKVSKAGEHAARTPEQQKKLDEAKALKDKYLKAYRHTTGLPDTETAK